MTRKDDKPMSSSITMPISYFLELLEQTREQSYKTGKQQLRTYNRIKKQESRQRAGHGADTPLPDTAPAPTDQGGSR